MLVPPVVRNKALAAGAARWLDELPVLIADLEADWGITVGPPYPDATKAFVAEAEPAPASGLPTGADKGRWLIGYIETTWPELDRPCSERAVEHALACAARRVAAHDHERAVLIALALLRRAEPTVMPHAISACGIACSAIE